MIKRRAFWYQLFKYAVYLAVFINVFLFLRLEIVSANHRFSGDFSFLQFIDAYTSTIDTAAWVILLILFELETYVIDDDKLKGGIEWTFKLIRAVCYFIVVSSLVGYCESFIWLLNFETTALSDLCQFVGASWMKEVDEFSVIAIENCSTLSEGDPIMKYAGKDIYTTLNLSKSSIMLALVDVLNSLSWILVVIILEVDVWLQLRNKFSGWIYSFSNYFKNILYLVLILAAFYWGFFGTFLDFWDAFMWIVAFFFIEMNLIEWKKETDIS